MRERAPAGSASAETRREFKQELERHPTGKETEPWEILYFKAYKSQLPVIERALEAAALMLGTDRSRGYCLEMICADFLAGVSLETGSQDAPLSALTRLVLSFPVPQREKLSESVQIAFPISPLLRDSPFASSFSSLVLMQRERFQDGCTAPSER